MENNIKDMIDRRLANLVSDEEHFINIMNDCELLENKSLRRKWSKRRKVALIFATMFCVLTLMGAGMYYEYKTYRFSGVADEDTLKYKIEEMSRTLEEYSMSNSEVQSVIMTESAELALDEDDSWRTIHSKFMKNGSSSTSSPYHLTDVEKVERILESSVNKMLYPSYIPNEYSFTEAYISLYISPDMMMLEPIKSQLQDDAITETYLMPESIIRNVESVTMQYVNAGGDILEFHINLNSDGNPGFGASGKANVKTITEDGFNKSIIIQEPDIEKYGYTIIGYFQNPITPIDYAYPSVLGIEYRYLTYDYLSVYKELYDNIGMEGIINTYLNKYDNVMYSVEGNTLSEDELLKIIRSIK